MNSIVEAASMAEATRRTIRQNIAWAIAYNLTAVPLAVSGILAPWMAALGMSASSLLVVLNALRLRRHFPATGLAPTMATVHPRSVPAAT
jgi:Cu2+-exporting ATPase